MSKTSRYRRFGRASTLLALFVSACVVGSAGTGVASAATTVIPAGATAVSVGTHDTFGVQLICALVHEGTVQCWGENAFGQLGNGTEDNSSKPVTVFGIDHAMAVSAGGDHACALLPGGTVSCWGSDSVGQLGNGTQATARTTPVQVTGIANAVAISAGGLYTCALLGDGTARCWGWNGYGQLGNGTTEFSTIPVNVSGLAGVIAISPGLLHTCALLGDGTVRCWGDDTEGALGDGSIGGRSLDPVAVAGLSGVTQITSGLGYSCALLLDRTARCWGWNDGDALGDGLDSEAQEQVGSPVDVLGLGNALSIDAGWATTCAVIDGGAVECWGSIYGDRRASPVPTPAPGSESTTPAPPQVEITGHPPKETADQTAEFKFAGVAGGTYQCSIDDGAWTPCRSGDSVGPLQPGDHRFQVRETANGVTGAAASWSWTIDLPKSCVLEVARARVFAFAHQGKARLVIHYKAYRPARVSVSYSLSGAAGSLALGTASADFKTAGVFRLGESLSTAADARLRGARSMKVRFQVPHAPSSCSRYYTKQLTIPKKVFGQTVWFQSDSVFGPGAK